MNKRQANKMALPVGAGMDMAAAAVWSTIAVLLTTAMMVVQIMVKRNDGVAAAKPSLPPVVSITSLIIPVITRGPRAVVDELYRKLGSVFTISFLGMKKMTFLIGPEVLRDFYTRPDTEVHHDAVYQMTVPIFGKGVMYDVDINTRAEQIAFCVEALRPTKLRSNAVTMVRETQHN
uniref:Uncharacterized protein n=1 Tax=Leersia perrieri TaxID=77586 RepID=A0A0D9X0F7_9ORYZ